MIDMSYFDLLCLSFDEDLNKWVALFIVDGDIQEAVGSSPEHAIDQATKFSKLPVGRL